jgi:hypothetical protein
VLCLRAPAWSTRARAAAALLLCWRSPACFLAFPCLCVLAACAVAGWVAPPREVPDRPLGCGGFERDFAFARFGTWRVTSETPRLEAVLLARRPSATIGASVVTRSLERVWHFATDSRFRTSSSSSAQAVAKSRKHCLAMRNAQLYGWLLVVWAMHLCGARRRFP